MEPWGGFLGKTLRGQTEASQYAYRAILRGVNDSYGTDKSAYESVSKESHISDSYNETKRTFLRRLPCESLSPLTWDDHLRLHGIVMAKKTNIEPQWLFCAALIAGTAVLTAMPAQAQLPIDAEGAESHAWTDAAEACYQSGDNPAGAIDLCTEAITSGELTGDFLAITYSNRGNSRFDLGEFDLAVADYDAALDLVPDDATTLSNRGAALLELKNYPMALDDFNLALQIAPENAMALTNRCWVHAVQENYELAGPDCDAALGLEPLDPIALSSRAYVRMKLGDLEGATEDAALAVQFGANQWRTHFYQGLAFEMSGNLDEAVTSLQTAAQLAPEEPRIREKLAELGVR